MTKKIAGIYETKQQAWEAIEAFRSVKDTGENSELVHRYRQLADAIQIELVGHSNSAPRLWLDEIVCGANEKFKESSLNTRIDDKSRTALKRALAPFEDNVSIHPASVASIVSKVRDSLESDEAITDEMRDYVIEQLAAKANEHFAEWNKFSKA